MDEWDLKFEYFDLFIYILKSEIEAYLYRAISRQI